MTHRVDPVAHLRELSETAARAADLLGEQILAATQMVRETIASGGTLFFAGNGGSAADAQHIATEYVVRYQRAPAIARKEERSTGSDRLAHHLRGREDLLTQHIGRARRRLRQLAQMRDRVHTLCDRLFTHFATR